MPIAVDDFKWRKIAANVASIARRVAKVGVMDGAGAEDDGKSLAEIAAIHEFGAPDANIPERSFIRSTFHAKEAELGKLCERVARAIVLDGMSVDQALGIVGAWGAAAIRRTITGTDVPPPLAPATVAAKGSSKPLVDTGRLVNAISWVVGDPER